MAENYVGGTPGIKTERSAAPRKILATTDGAILLPGGKVVDGSESRDPLNTGDVDVLRAGLVMGKITSSSKYAPSILGALSQAYDKDGSLNTTMTVSTATATEIVRRIGTSGTFKVTGPPTASGTVATETVTFSNINTATGAVTITTASNDFIAGSFVQPTDGSETPLGLIGDGYGIKVTDADGNDIDVPLPNLLIAGVIDASQIINYPSDSSLKTWLKTTQLSAVGLFCFDDAC